MLHAAQKDVGVLMLKRGQCPRNRDLGPTLRIALYRIFKKSVESGEQLWSQLRQAQLSHSIRRFGHQKVVTLRQRLAQRLNRQLG